MKPDNTRRNARIVALAQRMSARAVARKLGLSKGVVAGVIYRHQHRPEWLCEALKSDVQRALDKFERGMRK